MPGLLQLIPPRAGLLIACTSLSLTYGHLAHATLSTEKSQVLSLDQQRALYLKTKEDIRNDKLEVARQGVRNLGDYPLRPYLQVALMRKTLHQLPAKQIKQFITQNRLLPAAERLHQSWLGSLAANGQWKEFQQAYKLMPVRGNHYRCLSLRAKIELNYKEKSLSKTFKKEIDEIWQQGSSMPNSCDAVFARWEQEGGLTSKIASVRFWNAIKERNFDLARYVQSKISDKNELKDAELFWQVRKDPAKYLKPSYFQAGNSLHGITVNYAARRLSNNDLPLAVDSWLALRDHLNVDQETQDSLNRYLSVRLAARFHSRAEELLAKLDPDFTNVEVSEWKIRLAMDKQDWALVTERIKALPLEEQMTSRWSYWMAVAQQHLTGQRQDDTLYRISQERNYYGFLAADLLGMPYSMNYQPANIPAGMKNALLERPGIQRMKELVHHREWWNARREWNRQFIRLNKKQRHAMAYLAKDWQWHSQAIIGAAKLKEWNDLDLRFPLEYPDLYRKFTKRSNIPFNWALSITRKESAFNPRAKSGVGARGLMQLMPRTATETANYIQQRYSGKQELYSPATNISLGTAYLAQMRDRFGSRIYATAAYNAGPHRVKKWLKARGNLPLDIWIELIPFKETRKYVQTVLEYGVIYDTLANLDARLMQDNEQQMLALSQLEQSEKNTGEL